MRLAVVSDGVLPTPQVGAHGLGAMVSQVAEGLHTRCHDVTLFAKPGSRFSGALVTPADCNGYEGEKALAREVMRIHRQNAFDAILDCSHIHELAQIFPDLPVVNVYHDIYQPYTRCSVIVSHGQRYLMPQPFDHARVIHNALPANAFIPKFEHGSSDYVLFMGALVGIKQPVLAIEACARLGVKLILTGAPAVGQFQVSEYSTTVYRGVAVGKERDDLLRNARVFLQLGTHESFGLTTLEAMLSGTPVVAWPSGGSLDIVRNRINGIYVGIHMSDKVQAVANAIEQAWYMNRQAVYDSVQTFNSIERQLTLYEDALGACMRGEWW